jgi:two-component system, LytTR family, sensor kinase
MERKQQCAIQRKYLVTDATHPTSFYQHVSRARPFGFFAMFFLWTLVGFLSFGRFYFQEMRFGAPPPFWDSLIWLACFYPWAVLAPLVFSLEGRFRLSSGPRGLGNFFILLAFGVPLAFVASELDIVFARTFEYLRHMPLEPFALPRKTSLISFVYHEAPYWVTIAASYILRHFGQLRERERETARLALEKSELQSTLRLAQLETLRMKLNPHFLFNTLQNISVLALQDPPSAIQMLTRLGDLLRASFRKDSQQEIPLAAEIALTRAYLEIERVRFRERLSVLVEIAPGTENALVPTFLLQPLVENAIKHGLTAPQLNGHIEIRSVLQPERLVLTVADNGSGITAASLQELQLGIGLGATFERLQRLYPGEHEFAVRNVEKGGTEVRIALPFHITRFSSGTANAQSASDRC